MDCKTRKMMAIMIVSILVAVCLASCFYGQSSSGVRVTIDQDGDLFTLTVETDYHFDEYLKEGSNDLDEFYDFLENNVTNGTSINGVSGGSCSTFVVGSPEDDLLFARNFDFRQTTEGLVKTDPTYGYASYSMVDLRMFGHHGYETLDEMIGNDAYLAVAYIPMDGVNEAGVSVTINALHNGMPIYQDTGKTPIFTTAALRLILDYADDVDSAVELVKQYDLRSNSNYHIMVSDRYGNSKAIEIVDNETIVTDTVLMTNHYITEKGKDTPVTPSSQYRYDTIANALRSSGGVMTVEEAMAVLSAVSQNDGLGHMTRWSLIYNMTVPSVTICLTMDYSVSYHYVL